MSAVSNYRNLTRLLAGKDRRTIHFGQFSPLTVEKIEGEPLISLRHQSAGEDKNAPSTEVVFLVQGNTARAVYFQNETVEQATVPELFPRVMVAPQFQRILDRFVSDSWRDLENRGYFAVAEDMAMAKEKRGRLYFGKPAPDPALLHQALPTEKASPPIHTSTKSKGEPQMATEKADSHDVYERVTAHVLAALETNPGEWKRPWHTASVLPLNASSQRQYGGINVISLWVTSQMRGYTESAEWATYKQWTELGAQVRKGEKASPVVFFKDLSKEGETTEGEEEEAEGQEREGRKRRFVAKGYWVFNAAQVDGYKPPEIPKLPESERIKRAEDFFVGVGADIRHGGNQAFYNRDSDHIQMPAFGVFHSAEHYYSCVAHELCHWSGAQHRTNRDLSGRFGSAAYAAEELVAEIGAAFQMAKLELSAQPRPEHAAYISHWIKLLREDNRAIFTAAAKAQQATDWLFREHELRQQKEEEKATSEMKPEPAIAADLTPPESIELHSRLPETREAREHAQGNSPPVKAGSWKMQCLICPPEDRHEYRNLVAIQEHAMDEHGYTQEDHRNTTRTKLSPNHYQWTFPDGRTWLDAVKTAEIVRDQGDVQQEAKAQQEQAASRRETVMPTAEERRLNRVETAERALSIYTDQDREANLTDLLADAMHLSKQEGIDFERCLERARAHYRTEVHEAQQELSRETEKDEERGLER